MRGDLQPLQDLGAIDGQRQCQPHARVAERLELEGIPGDVVVKAVSHRLDPETLGGGELRGASHRQRAGDVQLAVLQLDEASRLLGQEPKDHRVGGRSPGEGARVRCEHQPVALPPLGHSIGAADHQVAGGTHDRWVTCQAGRVVGGIRENVLRYDADAGVEQHARITPPKVENDLAVARGDDRVQMLPRIHIRRGDRGLAHELEGEDDIAGVDRLTIRPHRAVSQKIGERGGVGTELPALGQRQIIDRVLDRAVAPAGRVQAQVEQLVDSAVQLARLYYRQEHPHLGPLADHQVAAGRRLTGTQPENQRGRCQPCKSPPHHPSCSNARFRFRERPPTSRA